MSDRSSNNQSIENLQKLDSLRDYLKIIHNSETAFFADFKSNFSFILNSPIYTCI